MKWKSKLPVGSPSLSNIKDCFEYIKKHQTVIDNPLKRVYVNKIENKITLKIKEENYLKLLTLETIKLLGSTQKKTDKDIKLWKSASYRNYWSSISQL